MRKFVLSYVVWMCGLMITFCQARTFQAPEISSPPDFSGGNSEVWESASVLHGFYHRRSGYLESRQGRVFFAYDKTNFYLRIESELPPNGNKLLASVRKHDGKVFWDDNIEIWLASDYTDKSYQYQINLFGTVCDVLHDSSNIPDESVNVKWKKASYIDSKNKCWVVELGIPLSDAGIQGNPVGKKVRLLVSRNWKRPAEQTPFIQNEAPFTNTKRYAEFVMNPQAPVIKIDGIGALHRQLFDLKGKIKNRGKQEKTYALHLNFSHSDMPETRERRILKLLPGESGQYHFHDDGNHIHARASHKADFTIEESGKVLYGAQYAFKTPIDLSQKWKIEGEINRQFQFSIYPGLNRAGISFEAEKAVTAAQVELVRGGKKIFTRSWKNVQNNNSLAFDIPSLESGTYDIILTVFAGKKVLRRVSKQFVREVFPWENNQYGVTEKVYPPFKPLQVEGRSLSTVCNRLEFTENGWFSSISPRGKKMSSGAMKIYFGNSSKEGVITGKSGKFVRVTDAVCSYLGKSRTDCGFEISTLSHTEYDGCTRFEMTLTPEKGRKPELSSFYLDIPLENRQIRLLHVIKSGQIRTNPAIRIPAGEGVIWRSTQVGNGDFYGNMHIYLWLGEVDRGISWFAENDRNFSVDDKQPVQEIIRNNGVLTLRVHFVNRRFVLDRPRTIVFGMQASPVKPMPKDWLKPKMMIPPHGGSNYYWGIRPAYCGKYPVGYDWEYVDQMVKARESGKIDRKYIESFIQKHYKGLPSQTVANYRGHAIGGHLGMMAKRGMDPTMLYFEEHAQDQTTPEWRTFQDEWGLVSFTPREWLKEADLVDHSLLSTTGVLISPVKSYRDFAAYYAREWLKRGVGIYCDNTFPRNTFSPMNSQAYIREDGTVQPAADIWDMRAYHKRLWVLVQQMKSEVKWPLMLSLHVTNGMILPIVCWADIQLDLEWGWASGFKPFPIELLEIETTGRQIGVYPHAHYPIVGCGQVHEDSTYLRGKINEDMVRTDWAMRMIYGVLRYDIRGENFSKYNSDVYAFGFGSDRCRISNYWDEDYPLVIDNELVKSILLQRGGHAKLILASWNDKPVMVRIQADRNFQIRSARGIYPEQMYDLKKNSFRLTLDKYGMQQVELEVK